MFARRAIKRRPPLGTRTLHDGGIWGHQTQRQVTVGDFTPTELTNRIVNASLLRLVESYRRHGHRAATLDPLNLVQRPSVPALDPRRYGFNVAPKLSEFASDALPDLSKVQQQTEVDVTGILDFPGEAKAMRSVEEVANQLQDVYCSGIGFEFMHLPSKHERRFLEQELEKSHLAPLSTATQLRHWELLAKSEAFDKWAGKRFPQVKRYGLEGGEGMMVALASLFEQAEQQRMEDVVLAIPHRGRLNVLTQLLDLDMRLLVRKMRGLPTLPEHLPTEYFTDDVLSHLFTSSTLPNTGLRVHLLPNPSHLEAVGPAGIGFARGLQVPFGASKAKGTDSPYELGQKVLSLQVHGDAAFGGQGIVAESLNLASLPHFNAGGSIRLVLNNQLGYTTDAAQGRTSFYATDLAKSISAPILHVNGDRIDDVHRATKLAFTYQQKFGKDIVIDLICYRRRGHNELDEPSYTSPQMYSAISILPSVPQIYEKSLIDAGTLVESDAKRFKLDQGALFDKSLEAAEPQNFHIQEVERPRGWSEIPYATAGQWQKQASTGVSEDVLLDIGKASVTVPDTITMHPRIKKMHVAKRLQSLNDGKGLDFATCEALAFGSLLLDGYHVRLCGQDSGRGTFSQRHAIIADQTSKRAAVPLQSLSSTNEGAGTFEVVNSPLSEYAVIAFEQGLAWVSPQIFPIWEAQFGDFLNTAQVAVDTFWASCESKWGLQSALTLLLPHGYDSAGPEHSSARIERLLQLTNEPLRRSVFTPNAHLVNVTTAAQYFHLLRRQMCRPYRKPLAVFSPKGILRLPAASSLLSELGPGTSFQPVLSEEVDDPESVERIVFLSGKMYYDLVKTRSDRGLDGKVVFVRLEEISPFPYQQVEDVVKKFSHATSYMWAQEGPENAEAWSFVQPRLGQVVPGEIRYAGRRAMSTPAPGVSAYFSEQKVQLLDEVFEGLM